MTEENKALDTFASDIEWNIDWNLDLDILAMFHNKNYSRTETWLRLHEESHKAYSAFKWFLMSDKSIRRAETMWRKEHNKPYRKKSNPSAKFRLWNLKFNWKTRYEDYWESKAIERMECIHFRPNYDYNTPPEQKLEIEVAKAFTYFTKYLQHTPRVSLLELALELGWSKVTSMDKYPPEALVEMYVLNSWNKRYIDYHEGK